MNDPRWEVDYLTEKLAERSDYVKGKWSSPNVRRAMLWIVLFVCLLIVITVLELALR